MIGVDKAVVASYENKGKRFEILVNPKKAWEFKQGKINDISEVVVINEIYRDARKAERASQEELKEIFNTTDFFKIAEIILKKGKFRLTAEQKRRMIEEKKIQIANIISRRAINPQTNAPHPPKRILNAMEQAKVSIDPFIDAELQVDRIIKQISSLLPLKFEISIIEIKVPLKYIGSPEIIQIGVYTDTDIMEPFWNTLSRLSSLSISVLPTNVIMGKTVTVSGSISPPHNNVSIMLIYKLPSGTILTRNVTSTALGGFEDTFTPKMAGSWTVKARWAGDLDHEGAESSEVSFMVLKPARFCVTDLSIAPTEVKVGEIITISVNVTNTGDVIGTFTVALWVNSSIEATRNVTLAGGESMIVTFKLTKDVPGTYNIEVAGLKGTILVKQKPPPWGLYATIAAGIIIAMSTAIIAYRKKRKPPMRESGIKEV